MEYGQYIAKKRMRVPGICGPVNIPWGTVLAAVDGFLIHEGKAVCAIRSENTKKHFWGYDPNNPQAEIKRQKTVVALMAAAPPGGPTALMDPANPWRKYGTPDPDWDRGGWLWVWKTEVEDLPLVTAGHLLTCIRGLLEPAV